MEQGWIKIHRKLLSNPLLSKPIWAWLWVVLLLKTNHKKKQIIWNGQNIVIESGQFITGRKQLSEESGIPESTIERILSYLESEHQIGQQKTTKYRLITILNWNKYQNRTSEWTTDGQQMDTNKNDNNEKKINNNTETKVSNKQIMKNSFKYNENKHTDAFEDTIDYETNEAQKKPKKVIAPFDLEKELEKMEQEENSYSDIIAIFIREKKIPVENRGQLSAIQYRHTTDAKKLSGAYTNVQIFQAIDEVKKEMKDVDWTLGTVLKVLTK